MRAPQNPSETLGKLKWKKNFDFDETYKSAMILFVAVFFIDVIIFVS